MSDTRHATFILGDLFEDPEGGLSGWCWSPDRPLDRLVVVLFADNARLVSTPATIYRDDIARLGLGDGRHGFVVTSEELSGMPDNCLVTAQEQTTNQVFGRFMRGQFAAEVGPGLASVQAGLRRCWTEAAGIGRLRRRGSRVGSAMGMLGDRLQSGSADPVDVAGHGLRRRFKTIHLPRLEPPDISVVFRARADVETTIGLVMRLGRACFEAGAELVVLDDGRDPRTALIRLLAPSVVHVNVRAESLGGAVNLASRICRGGFLALLDDSVAEPSAAALAALPRDPGVMMVGPAPMDVAGRTGMAARLAPGRVAAVGRLGLGLFIAAEAFESLGGLDPCIEGGQAFAVLDLCLRGCSAGLAVRFHDEPAAYETGAEARPPAGSQEAFNARWQGTS